MLISGNPYRRLENKIPEILKVYNTSNFTLKLKARVFFNICIVAIFALLILIAASVYVQLYGPENKLNYHILIPNVVLLIVFIVSLFLLVKGKYNNASHLFLISANICVWYIMLFGGTEHVVMRLDTVVLILAIINSIPLFIHKYKSTIIIYVVVNLAFLLLFVQFFKNDYGLTNYIIVDYLVDTSIAILFSGVAAYQIVRINNKALDKVETDYHKRIHAEKALKDSEDFRKTIFENSTIPIVVMDSKTLEYIDLNDSAIKIFGFDHKEHILGTTLFKLSPSFQYDGASSEAKALYYFEKAKNEGAVRFEWLHQKPNGDLWDSEVHLLSFELNDKLFYQFSIIDITEQKKTLKELQKSEKNYRTLMENLDEVILMVDLDDKVQYVNKKFTEKLGYTLNEIKNKISYELLVEPNDQEIIKKANQQRIKKQKSQYELTFKAKNGNKIDFLVNGAPVLNDEGKVIGSIGAMVDISYRKMTERALRESEEQLKMALLGAKIGMWDWDMINNKIRINDLFVEMLGYKITDFKDSILDFNDWKKMVHEDDFDSTINLFNDHIENRTELYEAVFRMKHKTGHWKWILARGRVLEWNNNKPIRALGTHLDITNNKKAQIELIESEEKYREMAELLPIAIWETNLEGVCTYSNKVGFDIHGYTFNDLVLGINVLDLIIPEEKDKALNGLKDRLEGRLSKGEEYMAVKKDGTKFPARIYTSVIYKKNKPFGYRGVTVDITETKRAEKELKESEEKYRTIIEAFPDIIMISDLKNNIIFGNSALEKITGITLADYYNPNRKAQIHPKDISIVQNAIRELLKGNQTHTGIVENRFIDAWGNIHWFSGIISKLVVNNETFLQTITRDVTDKKKTEQELEKYRAHLELLVQERTEELAGANEELTAANDELIKQREELEAVLANLQNTQKQLVQSEKMASLGVLASGIAHEINNPLNFIKGGVYGLEAYLKENLKDHLADLSALLEGINEGIYRATDIVSSLNHYNRREDTKMVVCDMHSIIDHSLIMLKNQTRNRIEVEKNYTAKRSVLGNEGKLYQVILNVLSNAVQSINKKGTINIKTFVKNKNFKLQITDTGCGISSEYLDKILDPFFTTKEPGKGVGLGLSITHNILQEHNGFIEFKSKPNKGTIVLITLPIKDTNDG